jgi:hypothetical protein
MADQTEAQRLAEQLETEWPEDCDTHAIAAELRRLDQHELANNVWHEKTEWVQDTAQPHELGMHRADVLRQRIDRLEAVNKQLLEALEMGYADTMDYIKRNHLSGAENNHWIVAARAAIAAAKGEA